VATSADFELAMTASFQMAIDSCSIHNPPLWTPHDPEQVDIHAGPEHLVLVLQPTRR
jgi:hypothetical protein